MQPGRTFPIKAHLAGALALPARPPVPPAIIISQARARVTAQRYRDVPPAPHLAKPVISLLPPKPSIRTNQAVKRGEQAFAERFLPYKAHVPLPVIPRGPPVRPAIVISQALQRPYIGRTVPLRPRVAPPVVSHLPVGPPPFIASIAIQGSYVHYRRLRDVPPAPHLPKLGSPPPVPPGTFVYQAVQRPLTRRTVPKPHYAAPVPPLFFIAPPPLVITDQSLQRALLGRGGHLHLAPPVVSELPVGPPALVVSIAVHDSYLRGRRLRDVPPAAHVAPPVKTPAGPGSTVKLQAISRALLGRGGHVHLPPPPAPAPVPRGTFVSQALQRPLTRRTVPKPHLAGAVLAVIFTAPPPLVISEQALRRSQIGRGGAVVRLVAQPSTPPQPPAIVKTQAIQRPLVGRTVPLRPRVAPPVVSHVPPVPAAVVKQQALSRALLGRGGHVHLPPPPSAAPVPRGTFVSQALQRPLLGRGPLPPKHLAGPIVLQPASFRTAAFIYGQAVQRAQERRWRDVVPQPRVAPRTLQQPGPGATIKLQALSRALLGRGGHVHLPPPVKTSAGPGATIRLQAVPRSRIGWTPPKPHLPSLGAPPPVRPTIIIDVAVARAAAGERRLRDFVPQPHVAPPVKTPAGPGATIKLQAVQRGTLTRSIPLRPRVAPPVSPIPQPVLTTRLRNIHLQAIGRAYIGRNTPYPHLAPPLPQIPPAIHEPTHATITAYGSTGTITGYGSSAAMGYSSTAAIHTYSSTESIHAYGSTEAIAAYTSTGAITGYSSTEAIVTYSSTAAVTTDVERPPVVWRWPFQT